MLRSPIRSQPWNNCGFCECDNVPIAHIGLPCIPMESVENVVRRPPRALSPPRPLREHSRPPLALTPGTAVGAAEVLRVRVPSGGGEHAARRAATCEAKSRKKSLQISAKPFWTRIGRLGMNSAKEIGEASAKCQQKS